MSNFSEGRDPTWYLRLVDVAQDSSAVPTWSQADLADVWNHQLDAGVAKCIEELGLVHALHCQTLCENAGPPITSVRELFDHPAPDLKVLTMVGKWMERELGDTEESLPRDIARALFNVSLVLARIRCQTNLISSTDGELGRRAAWVKDRPWIDDVTRRIMNDAALLLGGADSEV